MPVEERAVPPRFRHANPGSQAPSDHRAPITDTKHLSARCQTTQASHGRRRKDHRVFDKNLLELGIDGDVPGRY
jgi:hypothetical protein